MDRPIALKHHLDLALDHASILVALAQHRLAEQDILNQIRARQHLQIDDHLHLFSFHARKSIELASMKPVARELPIAHPNDAPPPEIIAMGIATHTTKDLWWVLNHIVHSRFLSISESELAETASEWTMGTGESIWTPSVFQVLSDHDSDDDVGHWVEVCHLVRAFLTLVPGLEGAAKEGR